MTLIGERYQLGNSIGAGGMSDVYVATDILLGREVAVKMLRVDMARDENFRERFRREAQNSARLNHPNIVSVYDTGETNVSGISVPYIIMERVKGRDLRDIIREDGPLSPEDAAELLLPVTYALQASHDAGIIHRDVKPANIMVTSTGEVKVMDFGIARALDDSTGAMTQTSAVIGTAQYLSPEQARGRNADGRSDVYALGCVMYETVTGTPPFEGETPFAVAYQHVQEEPEPPSSRISNLSETEAVNVDAVILTAMAKHPADRYQSATEMGEDLERLRRGAVTQAARNHVAHPEEEPDYEYEYEYVDDPTQTAVVPQSRYLEHRNEQNGTSRQGMKLLAILLAAVITLGGGAVAFNKVRGVITGESNSVVTVPSVVGKTRSEAVAELEDLGLQVTVNESPHPDVPRGEVLSINPTEGSQLKRGANVTLTVSSGREITDVPDLTGLTPQEAATKLEKAGLKLNDDLQRGTSDTVEDGKIMSQNPAGGTQISKGSKVSVTVSTGHEKVKVPAMRGMNIEQVESTFESLGLKTTRVDVDSSRPVGEVLAIAGEGTEVQRETTIELRVSNGQMIRVPDLTGQSREEAVTRLGEMGWTGRLITGDLVDTASPSQHGIIAGHRPGPNEEVRKNGDITVDLWRNPLLDGVQGLL